MHSAKEHGCLKRRFIKNAVSNLSRGGAAAVVAILLPPILVRHMMPDAYAVWVLILQIVAYISYLDFGLQTAVGRYIAFANAKKDTELRDGIFSTAVVGLLVAAIAALVLILIAAAAAREVFPSVPEALLVSMRLSVVIVGGSVALGLPASACTGVFAGLQRYELPAITTGVGKLLSAIGLIWAALSDRSLVFMACILATTNLLSYGLQFGMLRCSAPEIRFRRRLINKSTIRELSGYCFSLAVWSFSMLLVSGLDVILVARFQFSAVVPYSISSTLIAFLGGIQYAIFGVIIPHAAGLHAHKDSRALGDLVVRSTKIGVLMLLVTGLPLIVLAAPLIRVWIGPEFVQTGTSILIVLVVANMLRLTGAPYASIVFGSGQQRRAIAGPLMEGFTNLGFSIWLGLKYGAIGVAWGTLIGAAVGVLATVCYNLTKTRDCIQVSQLRYLGEALAAPALCGIPVYVALLVPEIPSLVGSLPVLAALLASFCICAAVLFRSMVPAGQ